MRPGRTSAFTLVEAIVVLALVGALSLALAQRIAGYRLAANESAARATLGALGTVQAQFVAAVAKDRDGDGRGEYGFYDELARFARVGGLARRGDGLLEGNGYLFELWLEDDAGGGVSARANASGAASSAPDADESRWRCYAWPARAGLTGRRAFYVDERGEVRESENRG